MNRFAFIILIPLLLLVVAGKAKTPAANSPWLLYSHNGSWAYKAVSASPSITIPGGGTSYPTFLVSTTMGSVAGKTLNATVTLEDITGIYYPGITSWNSGGLPANIRFFVSSSTSYDLSDANQDKFWWSPEFYVADYTMTLSSSTVTSQWSNGMGKKSDDPDHAAAFQAAMANAKLVGIALCGGSFFDMGWMYYSSDGPGNLTITSLTAQ